MSRIHVTLVVFLAGLAAVCGIAAGYAGSNPLALAVTLLIGAFYVGGAFELQRYRHATATLASAVADLSEPPPPLDAWLARLHPSLRGPVRMRVEGARAALPGPALAPYLVGLLVLLGMLGTLLGMVATLKGTGAALESATDLHAIRASLAAPIKGLGFAFGTSIAGVSSSAMLGLLSALCRRERLHAMHALDAKIATTLRVYSHAHQRDETFRLLQRQADAMPVLVDRLQAMIGSIERQSLDAHARQIESHQAFVDRTQAAYERLAASIGQTLEASAAESARAAGAALGPVVDATMAGLAREAASLHDGVERAVQRQLDGLSSGFETSTANVARLWQDALAEQRRTNESLAQELHGSLDRFALTFEQRSTALVDRVAAQFDATAGSMSGAWTDALTQQKQINETLTERNQQALDAAAASLERHSASLLRTLGESHANWQAESASRDEARLETWTGTLGAMAAALGREWKAAHAQSAARQQEICDALARTAHDVSAETKQHAHDTIAEIARLVQAASEAPRIAAGVVAELRQKLSDSMARDTAMLDERTRLMETLGTLLDAVNRASTEQRAAIDALVATSADLLSRVGGRFAEQVDAGAGRLEAITAQLTGGALEVASLGDAFGTAVECFGQSNDKLVAHLERLESALERSVARSDEQLAYYVAQAREVVDLSMLSQKQIVEDLQRLAGRRALDGADAA